MFIMLWLLTSLVLALVVWYRYVRILNYWKRKGVTQSKPWLCFGDSWRLVYYNDTYVDNYLKWMYNLTKGRRYAGLYIFSTPALCVTDPDLIKQITVKDFDHFEDHNFISVDPKVDFLFGNCLLSLRGHQWRHMRTTLSPTFTASKMRIMHELIDNVAENVVNYFLSDERSAEVIELEMKDTLSRFTNDVIATTAFGLAVDSLKEQKNGFFLAGNKIFGDVGIFRIIEFSLLGSCPSFVSKLLGLKIIKDDVGDYFGGTIKEAIKAREEKNIFRPDMIQLLLETRKDKKNKDGILQDNGLTHPNGGISDDEIASQALIFFTAGFESVSQALSMACYELCVHKHVQDKLRREIAETYKKHGKPNSEVLQQMPYLDMVVSETLRKWPSIPQTDRKVTKPYTIQSVSKDEVPVELEVKTPIWIPIYAIHRAPEYYPNPDLFDPDRFSSENRHNIPKYCYMPFGVGPRNCIGARLALLEMKVLLFHLLLNFEIVPTKKSKIPMDLVSTIFRYYPKEGNWMGLKRVRA